MNKQQQYSKLETVKEYETETEEERSFILRPE